MDEMTKLTDKLSYIFLRVIIEALEKESMNEEEPRMLAQSFLALQPFSSVDDAKTKMHTYVQQHKEFVKLQEYMDSYHEEQKINAVIQKMQKHLQNSDIDSALQVAKST